MKRFLFTVLSLVSCRRAEPTAAVPSPQPVAAATSSAAHGAAHHPGDHKGHGMPHRFEDAEAWAKRFDDPSRDAWQKPDEVVKLMAIEPGAIVADLGAGTGYFLARLSRAVGEKGRVLALDVEPDMVRYMKARAQREGLANVEAKLVAPDDPGLAPDSVDHILILDTWHHIDDRDTYAKKLAAALRPKGRIVIVDFTLESERGPPPQHKLATDVIAKTFRDAGLKVELKTETLPDHFILECSR